MKIQSTKVIELGSTAFRQWRATSHCKYVHGYRLMAKFWFGCIGLDDKNWVVDFSSFKELKHTLNKQFDHTLCIANDDPLLQQFKTLHEAGGCDLRIMDGVGMEKFAQYCFNTADEYVRELTTGRCWAEKVEIWEHEKNSTIIRYNLADILPSRKDPKLIKTTEEIEIPAEATKKPIVQEPSKPNHSAAPLRNKVTSGYSNLFGGTSWGS